MAVTLVGQNSGQATLGGDPVVNVPAGNVGDVLLAVAVTTGAQTVTQASFTTHPNSIGNTRPLLYRVCDGSEPASYTFVTSGAANCAVVLARYSGVDAANPLAGTAGSVATTSTTVTIGAASPSVAAYLAHLVVKLNNATWTPPAQASPEDWDTNIATTGSTAGGHETVGTGSTGTRAWVASAGVNSGVGYLVPLRAGVTNLSVSGFTTAVQFGTPTLIPDQFVTPSGFAPAVSFGTPTLVPDQFVSPVGFDLAVAFGTPTIVPPATELDVAGFDLSTVFGNPGLRQAVDPDGFDLPVLFGTPTLVPDLLVQPDGFDVDVLFGTPALRRSLELDGFDLTVQFGTPSIINGTVLPVTGFDLTAVFGSPVLETQPFVTATVYNHETGQPVGAGATVQLFDAAGNLLGTTTTGPDGTYTFHLPFGFTDQVFTVVRVEIDGTEYQGVSPVCDVTV